MTDGRKPAEMTRSSSFADGDGYSEHSVLESTRNTKAHP